MATNKQTNKLEINTSIIDRTIREVVLSVYGVSKIDDGNHEKKGLVEKGITIHRYANHKFGLDVYLIVASDVKITEVLRECQNQLNYVLNKKFPEAFKSINVYVNEVVPNDKQ